jgi:hypothetical protein
MPPLTVGHMQKQLVLGGIKHDSEPEQWRPRTSHFRDLMVTRNVDRARYLEDLTPWQLSMCRHRLRRASR